MTENLILLPGAGHLPEVWTEVVNQLPVGAEGVKPRIPVLSGTLAEQQRQLETYLQKHEVGYLHLGGHGMGALLALQFALDHPKRVRSLVLSEFALTVEEQQLKGTRSAVKMLPGFLLRRRGIDKQKLLTQLDDTANLNLGEQIHRLNLPISVFSGPGSDTVTREAAAQLPGASYELVDTAGKPWFRERPELFAAAVARQL